jgi:hypothetical protein
MDTLRPATTDDASACGLGRQRDLESLPQSGNLAVLGLADGRDGLERGHVHRHRRRHIGVSVLPRPLEPVDRDIYLHLSGVGLASAPIVMGRQLHGRRLVDAPELGGSRHSSAVGHRTFPPTSQRRCPCICCARSRATGCIVYWKSFAALNTVCATPQASGTPTKPQARARCHHLVVLDIASSPEGRPRDHTSREHSAKRRGDRLLRPDRGSPGQRRPSGARPE